MDAIQRKTFSNAFFMLYFDSYFTTVSTKKFNSFKVDIGSFSSFLGWYNTSQITGNSTLLSTTPGQQEKITEGPHNGPGGLPSQNIAI